MSQEGSTPTKKSGVNQIGRKKGKCHKRKGKAPHRNPTSKSLSNRVAYPLRPGHHFLCPLQVGQHPLAVLVLAFAAALLFVVRDHVLAVDDPSPPHVQITCALSSFDGCWLCWPFATQRILQQEVDKELRTTLGSQGHLVLAGFACRESEFLLGCGEILKEQGVRAASSSSCN